MAELAEVVRRFYARVDGAEEGDAMELVSGDLQFAINLDGTSLSGGRAELRRYLRARDPSARRRHHVREIAAHGRVMTVLAESRGPGDEVLGTIVAAFEADDDGRLSRYLVTFSPGMTFSSSDTGA
jgi:hypothetical protein